MTPPQDSLKWTFFNRFLSSFWWNMLPDANHRQYCQNNHFQYGRPPWKNAEKWKMRISVNFNHHRKTKFTHKWHCWKLQWNKFIIFTHHFRAQNTRCLKILDQKSKNRFCYLINSCAIVISSLNMPKQGIFDSKTLHNKLRCQQLNFCQTWPPRGHFLIVGYKKMTKSQYYVFSKLSF